MQTKFTAVILAGGKSSRMKKNKALCTLGNKKIIEYSIEFFTQRNYEVIVSGDSQEYEFLNIKTVDDNFKNQGPLSGIEASFKIASHEKIILWSVDTPFISTALIEKLEHFAQDYDIVVPESEGYLQPLNALYSKSLYPHIKAMLEKNQPYLKDIIRNANTKIIKLGENTSLYNINTPEELEKAEKMLGSNGK
jgi:molybdopterin-guanine dinucleotide biosynthesis protein A